MTVETVTTFFALLAVLGLVALLSVGVIALVAAIRGGVPASLVPLREGLGQVALPLAFCVALTCTLGSLYLSEVAKFPPCELCWFQRILMYPQVVILGIAMVRRDAAVKWYSLPLVLIGLGISTYHYLVERFPDTVSFSCNTEVPCSTVWVWKFHFLSIPAMAGIGFALIAVLLLLARSDTAADHPAGTITHSRDDSVPNGAEAPEAPTAADHSLETTR
jgi:Disulfide bond formation protein DsbB